MSYTFKDLLNIQDYACEEIGFHRVLDQSLRAIALTRAYAAGTNGTVDPDSLFPTLLPFYERADQRIIPTSIILTGKNPNSEKRVEVFFRTTPSLDLQADLLKNWVFRGKTVYWEDDAKPERIVRIAIGETPIPLHLVVNLGSFDYYARV